MQELDVVTVEDLLATSACKLGQIALLLVNLTGLFNLNQLLEVCQTVFPLLLDVFG